MKKTLYLISKEQDYDLKEILASTQSSEHSVSAIFIQQGTDSQTSLPFPCFVLSDDIPPNNTKKTYSSIQYSDMLQMIFDADTVISL